MSGNVSYFELPSTDIEATRQFWGGLFGWEFRAGKQPEYDMIHGAKPMGGAPHDDASRHPRLFFSVDDIDAAVEKVRALGGTAEEPVSIPSGGAFVHCRDNQGLPFSLSQEAAPDH